MSESERLREFAELSFEISRLLTDPKDAEVARHLGEKYLADAENTAARDSARAPRPRRDTKRTQ